ncbi:MAG: GGDEF domain-containing protein [Oscillospiraceae bacterium]|nr:GGDEF domain-containing protein [Oscillospiraceae bacterium]
MKDKKRLTIGIMVHHLDNDYSKVLLKGAVTAAAEMDVNLVILPGRSLNCQLDNKKYTSYEYQYNTIYSYVSNENLDALVVSAGTIGQFVTKEEFKQFLDGFEGVPIITMENTVRGYPCVRLSGSGIKTMVSHLINEHGKKHIAFVSGPRGNADADERLAFYREALEENGIEYDPEMVAYGRFSEFCVDIVGNLIDRNKDKIDAICFANDMMCKGGYKAIEQRGLKIGRDIAVTGYDDSEIATALDPMLTTIRADAARLGSCAVKEAVKLAKGNLAEPMISLGSSIVVRQSCGCSAFLSGSVEERNKIIKSYPTDTLASLIISEYISESVLHNNEALIDELKADIKAVFDYAKKNNAGRSDPENYRQKADALISNGLVEAIQADTFIDVLKAVRYSAVVLCGDDRDKIISVHDMIEYCFETIADKLLVAHGEAIDDLTFTHFLINNIAKDMTINGNDEEKCYFSIVNNLYRTHMKSSYIYTYAEPVVHTSIMEWKRPKYLYLKSYHDGECLTAVKSEAQRIDSLSCVTNDFTPDRRRTIILFPLFMNEEHYGVIACEIEFEYFSYIYSVAPQICTAIKLTRLVNQLESSLDAATYRNKQLNKISMYDELTGVYNRRGFYEFTNRVFTAPENEGKRAVLIFSDLDNLKKINDNFGHEEGDYAITSAAGFLKSGLRTTDIVARIGGDEFAAFALCEDEKIIQSIPDRIKAIAAKHNEQSGKKYNVTISVGIYELSCNPAQNIQSFMDKADASLYEDKKKKNHNIFK